VNVKIIATSEVANLLDIKTSTVRKYVLILEAKGYIFLKNEKGHRLYTKSDVTYMREFKHIVDKGITLDEAAKLVAERFIKEDSERSKTTHSVFDKKEHSNDMSPLEGKINEILELLAQQERFNRELLQRLEDQQKYIDESLNIRDQRLLHSMKETLEERQRISIVEEREEKSKGIFAKLFGK
jgi:DNA-binding transcriptional MerR regulator